MKEKTPTAATHPMKIIAPTKDPVAWTIMPIAMGVIMPARLPIKLKTPPAKPTESAGAISPNGTPNNGRHPLSEESQSHNGNDLMKGVYVVCRHNDHGTQEPENNGNLSGL